MDTNTNNTRKYFAIKKIRGRQFVCGIDWDSGRVMVRADRTWALDFMTRGDAEAWLHRHVDPKIWEVVEAPV